MATGTDQSRPRSKKVLHLLGDQGPVRVKAHGLAAISADWGHVMSPGVYEPQQARLDGCGRGQKFLSPEGPPACFPLKKSMETS